MSRKKGAMHVATTRRQHGEKVYETHLLRHSYREGGKVKNETLANLSHLPTQTIALIRESLAGVSHVVAGSGFEIERSLPHGHVGALWSMATKLGLPALLGPPCAQRDMAMALIIARAARPASKLATTRWFTETTLGVDLGVGDAGTDELYGAMDWLRARQASIEGSLAARHIDADAMVLYDLSSSWMEGSHCPLAKRGYSRDRKTGKAQIEYGLMTDSEGRPISVEVFAGNTADPTAFISVIETLRGRLGLGAVTVVGDRGMITTARIEALRDIGGFRWITSLRAPAIQALASSGALQPSLFDESNLAEITHPAYPDERLVACRNPALATERARKRSECLSATEELLAPIVAAVEEGRLVGADKIALRVGRLINRYKMAKHFELDIGDDTFTYTRRGAEIAAEAALDGIYVIRTSVESERLDAPGALQAYKSLSRVERDFRSMKAVDLDLRPIYHWSEERVRAHVFICMLAAYLVWHLRSAWAPLCFTDEEPPERTDPVGPARCSDGAATKASVQHHPDGEPIHSFATLLDHLGTLTRNTVVFTGGVRIDKLALPTALQRRAFELIGKPIPARLGPM